MIKKPSLTILSGLSGAGKTTALQSLEDLGFFCVDNLPAKLLDEFVKVISLNSRRSRKGSHNIAVVIDARGQSYFKYLIPFIKKKRSEGGIRLIFLESRHDILVQRYSESRRRHPLSPQGFPLQGVRREKLILRPLRHLADKVIDTSDLNVHELRGLLLSYFQSLTPRREMQLTLISFGYRFGIPIESDMIFDVRFLPNPFFEPSLKRLTGRSLKVQEYILRHRACQLFLKKIEHLLTFLIREYTKEGKSYLTIAFGCTGGRHRSVAIVERLRVFFKSKKWTVQVTHRDESVGKV